MTATLAFDVYGTLIDTHGVIAELRSMVGDRAAEVSQRWREKQLEYTFRRGLMQNYVTFPVCTKQALDYTCEELGLPLSDEQKAQLMEIYKTLPAFSDVEEGLLELKSKGYRLYAFSNGTPEGVDGLLVAAGIREHFIDVVSVDEVKTFKPSPAVYTHFLRRSGATGAEAWLISSNPFDVIGAVSSGMNAAWVKRGEAALFDPWELEPNMVVSGVGDLAKKLP